MLWEEILRVGVIARIEGVGDEGRGIEIRWWFRRLGNVKKNNIYFTNISFAILSKALTYV